MEQDARGPYEAIRPPGGQTPIRRVEKLGLGWSIWNFTF